jgi:hypothetical protein
MSDYLCLILDRNDEVAAAHVLRSPDLQHAVRKAQAMSYAPNRPCSFQLWADGQMVASRFSKDGLFWSEMPPQRPM